MKYLLLNYMNETAMVKLPKEDAGQIHAAYMAYTDAMKKAGVLIATMAFGPLRRRPRCERPVASKAS